MAGQAWRTVISYEFNVIIRKIIEKEIEIPTDPNSKKDENAYTEAVTTVIQLGLRDKI